MGTIVTGCFAVFCLAAAAPAQTLDNRALNGKFWFRHVRLFTDASGNITDARSLLGAMTFDGSGHYSFTGQQVLGAKAPAALTGSGKYAVDPAGSVALANPQQ